MTYICILQGCFTHKQAQTYYHVCFECSCTYLLINIQKLHLDTTQLFSLDWAGKHLFHRSVYVQQASNLFQAQSRQSLFSVLKLCLNSTFYLLIIQISTGQGNICFTVQFRYSRQVANSKHSQDEYFFRSQVMTQLLISTTQTYKYQLGWETSSVLIVQKGSNFQTRNLHNLSVNLNVAQRIEKSIQGVCEGRPEETSIQSDS